MGLILWVYIFEQAKQIWCENHVEKIILRGKFGSSIKNLHHFFIARLFLLCNSPCIQIADQLWLKKNQKVVDLWIKMLKSSISFRLIGWLLQNVFSVYTLHLAIKKASFFNLSSILLFFWISTTHKRKIFVRFKVLLFSLLASLLNINSPCYYSL